MSGRAKDKRLVFEEPSAAPSTSSSSSSKTWKEKNAEMEDRDVKLEYVNEFGLPMTQKEVLRHADVP